MAQFKQTEVKGIWRDQAAFHALIQQYEIPDSVLDRGAAAIIAWINKAGPLAVVAGAAVLLAALPELPDTRQKQGIRTSARIAVRDSRLWMVFFGPGTERHTGNVISDSLTVGTDRERLDLPTTLIDSILPVDRKRREFIFKYLDGSYIQGSLITDPVMFEVKKGFLTDNQVLKVEARRIASIECLPTSGQSGNALMKSGS